MPWFPKQFSDSNLLGQTAVIVFLELFTTMVSNTGSSTAAAGAADLGVSKEIALIAFTTTYLLAQAVGGLVLPPIAETFGGRTLYITGAVAFTIGCVSMAASPTLPAVIAGRMISGFTSALPSTVAVSSFENMFDTRARIWVFNVWMASAVAALGIGPAVATYISTSALGW
jgi:MFS family permease